MIRHKFVKFYQILKNLAIKLSFLIVFLGLFLQIPLKAQEQDSLVTITVQDTLPTDSSSINVPKEDSSIDNIINYDAVDSIYFDIRNQKATLYGKAHVDYDDLDVNAPTIVVDLKNSRLEAIASLDSNGKVLEYPILKQGKEESQAKFIGYNWNTKRGYVEDVYMKQGGGYIHTTKAYLDEDKSMYVKNAGYTTCNLAQPHYHFRLNRAKIIPNDKVVGSLINLYIDSIPTPLGIPFAILPLQEKRTSGIILPAFNNLLSNGLSLQGLGFYWAINDSLSTTFSTDLYVSGSITLENKTDYKVRYKHAGSVNLSFSRIVNNFDEFDKRARREFSLRWNHRTASQRPRSLTADVNFETNTNNSFNFETPEELSVPSINSSISWQLPLRGIPFNGRVQLSHNQIKNSTGLAENNFTLPSYTLSYTGNNNPFKLLPYLNDKPSFIREKILNKFNITYANSGQNKASTTGAIFSNSLYGIEGFDNRDTENYDLTLNSLDSIFRRSKFSTAHDINLSLPISIGNFTLSPSFNYDENWYFSRSDYELSENITDDTTIINIADDRGFYRVGRYSTGASLRTTLYNFYGLGRKKTVKDASGNETVIDKTIKIRQTMQPSFGFRMSPDYTEDEETLFLFETEDGISRTEQRFRAYSSRPSTGGESRSFTFGLNNTFEMKLPETEKRKARLKAKGKTKNEAIKLFNLNLNTVSYNLAVDSLNLSSPNVALTTNLFNGLISVNASSTFDPYDYQETGAGTFTRVNTFYIENNNSLARLTNTTINSRLNLSPKVFKKNKKQGESEEEKNTNEPENKKISEYEPFNLPWTLNISYTYGRNYSNPLLPPNFTSNNLSFSGSLKLSQKWSTTGRVSYNIKENEFVNPSIQLNRDLHCWNMSFNWTPFGSAQGYRFNIGVNSGQLKALKWDKNNDASQRLRF